MEIIQFSHSNGFPASTYSTFFNYLPAQFELRYIEKFGMNAYQAQRGWDELTLELVEAVRTAQKPVIGLGHSLGGVLTYKAACRFPELFKAVIVIEPPIVLGRTARIIYLSQILGIGERMNPLAKRARVRKNYFSSRDEAFEYFRGKRLFKGFHPDSFQDYITHGLESSGEGIKLGIPRALEADIFNTLPTRYDWNFPLPLYFLYATSYPVLTERVILSLKKLLPQATFMPFSDGGHMYPMENPSACASTINKILTNF
ncbi:MAG: alpha/beta hydrolase [Bacteroidota bacterium]